MIEQHDTTTSDAARIPPMTGNGADDGLPPSALAHDVVDGPIAAMDGPEAGVRPHPSSWVHDHDVVAVNDAFMLGWKIIELRQRIVTANNLLQAAQQAPASGDGGTPYTAALDDPLWLAGVWHAIVNLIAAKHAAAFGDLSTRDTSYEPQGGWRTLLPYLYAPDAPPPSSTPDQDAPVPDGPVRYWDIGLAPDDRFKDFSLYDVVRRALNCLVLLHSTPAPPHSLLDRSIQTPRVALLEALQTDETPPPPAPATPAPAPAGETARCAAVSQLSDDCAQLLDAWDSFARENYYDGRQIPHDAAEQTAYEAGSALARLLWGLTAATAAPRIAARASDASGVAGPLYDAWAAHFERRNIVYIQHRLAALGATLDNAYRRTLGGHASPAVAADSQAFDPDLPSATLSCVTHSLDFWYNAVAWLDPVAPPHPAPPPQGSGHSSHPRLPGDHRLGAATAPGVTHPLTASLEAALGTALVNQASVWQALVTGQDRLSAYTVETVMHAVVEDVMDDFQRAVEGNLRLSLGAALRDAALRIVPAALIGLVAVLVLSVPGILWLVSTKPALAGSFNPNGLWAVLGVGPAIAALLGYRALGGAARGAATTTIAASSTGGGGAPAAPGGGPAAATTGNSAFVEYLGGMLGTIDAALLAMLQAATARIRTDLSALNHQVGVSYPLIECFVVSTSPPLVQAIRDDYAFMTQVIWSDTARAEEVRGVVRAALGPIGILINAHVDTARAADGVGPSSSGGGAGAAATS